MTQATTTPDALVMGGAVKTYEVFDPDIAEINRRRIKTLVAEKWLDILGPIVATEIGQSSGDVATALGVYEPLENMALILQSPEHTDVDVEFDFSECTKDGNLSGLVHGVRDSAVLASVADGFKKNGVVFDETLLAMSGANENLFATGVIKENPEVVGGFILEVTTEWDTLDQHF